MFKKLSPLLLAVSMTCVADQAMIVLDASGSMMGQVDGKAKITIAKETLNKVVNDWDESIDFGLMAYGHNRKGDCSDIEVLIPLSKIDKNTVLEKVKAITPKGKTPISDSLQQAAEKLHFTEDKATVILISDGKETCDADPCATAKALEEQGIDFTAHVIGFNVDTNTDKQLACIANATGGEYFSAQNANDLNSAMKKAVKKVEKKVVKKAPMKKTTIQAKRKYDHNLIINTTEIKDGEKVAVSSHKIYKSKGDEELELVEKCFIYDYIDNKVCEVNLPAGDYTMKTSIFDVYVKTTDFTIKEGETTIVDVIAGETGKLEIVATKDGQRVEAFIHVKHNNEGEKETVASCYPKNDKQCIVQLPAGTYEVEVTHRYEVDGRTRFGEDYEFEVTVKPNEHVVFEAEL